MGDLARWSSDGTLLEAICVGTAVTVGSIDHIGYEGKEDIVLPLNGKALGPIAKVLRDTLFDILEGRLEWEGWATTCDSVELGGSPSERTPSL